MSKVVNEKRFEFRAFLNASGQCFLERLIPKTHSPFDRKRRANASPKPRLAPVMMTTCDIRGVKRLGFFQFFIEIAFSYGKSNGIIFILSFFTFPGAES